MKVLLVSTDPAHNLSDAFCQKIGREPTPIEGFDNLSAMEIDANNDMEEMQRNMAEQGTEDDGGLSSMMSELTNSIPGIDEAMSFSELMKQVTKPKVATFKFFTNFLLCVSIFNCNSLRSNCFLTIFSFCYMIWKSIVLAIAMTLITFATLFSISSL